MGIEKVNEQFLDSQNTFSSCEFGLDNRLNKAVAKMQFVYATLVQLHCIPLALQGKDLLVRARTGSGKTAAFALPVLHKVLQHKEQQQQLPVAKNSKKTSKKSGVQVIVLVPTKELVEQTRKQFWDLMYYCRDVVSVLALGSQSIPAQQALLRDVPDIVIATPGRLVAHLQNGNIDLKAQVHSVVIDEADLVLSFGYGDDIRTIFNALPKTCQTFCMSATLSPELESLKRSVLHNPAVVKLEEGASDGKLQQFYLSIKAQDKDLLLYALLKLGVVHGKVIFFVNSTPDAYRLKLFFEQFLIKAAVLNAELPHNSRQHIIEEFNRGLFDYLIATDDSVDRDEDQEEEEEEEEEEAEVMEDDEVESDDNEDEPIEEEEEQDEDDDEENDKDGDGEDEDEDADSENDDDNEDEGEQEGDEADETEAKNTPRKKSPSSKTNRDSHYGVSRGVDFRGVTFVINVDFPKSVKSYTHRIGRTARGGANGTALSLIAQDDAKEAKLLAKIQGRQQQVKTSTNDFVKQPAQLDFDLREIDCFRYRVEDVRRAVTRVAVREAQLADVKKEMLNSEKLSTHFEQNPRDLNILQHDKAIGKAQVQPHLATIPSYLVPVALQAATPSTRAPKKRKHTPSSAAAARHNPKRRLDKDPLHTFSLSEETEQALNGGGDSVDGEEKPVEPQEDRISYGDRDVGRGTSGRQKWKQFHRKGRFNPKTIAKKKHKASKGFSH